MEEAGKYEKLPQEFFLKNLVRKAPSPQVDFECFTTRGALQDFSN
jgi:hypothetical protein